MPVDRGHDPACLARAALQTGRQAYRGKDSVSASVCLCTATSLVAGWLQSEYLPAAAETIAKIRTATKANMAKKAVQDKLRSAALGKTHSEESRVSCVL